jgi:hypothetical protein
MYMLTLAHIISILNIFAGALTAAGIVYFVMGFIIYLVRLGLPSRQLGIDYMSYACTCIFIVIAMLLIVRYVQQSTQSVIWFVALVLFVYLAVNISSVIAFFSPPPPPAKK